MGFGRGKGFTPRLIAQDVSHLLVVEQAGQTPDAEETSPSYIAEGLASTPAMETETTATYVVGVS